MAFRRISRGLYAVFLVLLGLAVTASEVVGAGKLLSHRLQDNTLFLRYERATAQVETVNGGTIHWVFAFSETIPERYSYAVVERPKDTCLGVEKGSDDLRVPLVGGEIRVSREGLGLEVFQAGQRLFSGQAEFDVTQGKVTVRMKESGERFFGLGCKTGAMELTGRSFENYNTDAYGYSEQSDPIYTTIPFYLAIRSEAAYGVFVDSPARSEFDFSKSGYSFSVPEHWAETYIFPGGVKQIVSNYTRLTGRPYLPPLWAFGFHQSRYSYMNTEEVVKVVEAFRSAELPLDAIHLDIDFLDRNRSFTHNPTTFPDPLGMNTKLAGMGIRTVVIADPAIPRDETDPIFQSGQQADIFLRKDGAYYEGKVWPGLSVFPDFTAEKTLAWWGPLYADSLQWGISGFWNDMNEPAVFNELKTMDPLVEMDHHGLRAPHKSLHNAYGLAMARATHLGLAALRPDQRVFLLSRAGYAGIQRYAFLWSGDNSARWSHLRMNVTMAASMGLSGAPYFGADIGGYVGNPSGELMARWIQAGTFVPFMRDHTGKGNAAHEPYAFPAERASIRKYLQLRYALIPYLYTVAWRASTEGEPINRPLFYDFGPRYLGVEHGFLFGRDLLVFPVLGPGIKEIEAVLPEGIWYGLFDRVQYRAGKVLVPTSPTDIPVFVRGGSILPRALATVRNTDELRKDRSLLLSVYPDSQGHAEGFLYEDDGISQNHRKGVFLKSTFSARIHRGSLHFSMHQEGSFPLHRRIELAVPSSVRTVLYKGKRFPVTRGTAHIQG